MINERCPLLHNMCGTPQSIISYVGNSPIRLNSKRKRSLGQHLVELKSISFSVNEEIAVLSPREILASIGVQHSLDPERTLIEHIDKRAEQLSVPDGCAVIRNQPYHQQIWTDLLAQLAIIFRALLMCG